MADIRRVSLQSGQKYSFLWTAASNSSTFWDSLGSVPEAEWREGHMDAAGMETKHMDTAVMVMKHGILIQWSGISLPSSSPLAVLH